MNQESNTFRKSLKSLPRLLGQVITIAAIAFLGWELHHQWDSVNAWRPTVGQGAIFIFLTLCYATGFLVLARNWLTMVTALVGTTLPTKPVLHSYTETQIAKYVPGNFMHLVSRHIYLKDLGVSHRPIAFATMLELMTLPIAAVAALCFFLPFADLSQITGWEWEVIVVLWALLAGGLSAGAFGLFWLGQKRLLRPMMIVLARATGFMLIQGALFGAVLSITAGDFVYLALPVAVLAWLVGFVTPGAPGGMAVREVVYVTFLSKAMASEDVLIAALIFRVMTILGDLTLYAFGRVFFSSHSRDV